MYVYMCMHIHIHSYIYIYVTYRVPHDFHENRKDNFGRREQRTYICIRVYIYMAYIYMHTYIYIHMYGRNIYIYEYTPIYIDMSRTGSRMSSMRMGQMSSSGGASGVYNISMYIRMYIYIDMYVGMCMYINMNIHLYTYIWVLPGPAWNRDRSALRVVRAGYIIYYIYMHSYAYT